MLGRSTGPVWLDVSYAEFCSPFLFVGCCDFVIRCCRRFGAFCRAALTTIRHDCLMTGSDVGAVAAVNTIQISFTVAVTMDSPARSERRPVRRQASDAAAPDRNSRHCRYRYPARYSGPGVM
jgi:hypothetical protein